MSVSSVTPGRVTGQQRLVGDAADAQGGAKGRGVLDVRSLVVKLIGGLPRGWGRLLAAAALSVGATGASVALLAVSAWLLSRAAEHPPELYLAVAATAVRTFGTSRGVFRYCERLLSHDVALRMQSALRLNVYDRLSRTTLLGARRGDLLIRVTADVEAIMDVIVRVVLPFASACVVLVGTSLILTLFDLPVAVTVLACSVVAGIVVPLVAQRMSARADAAAVPARADLAQVVHASARAATDIVAYGKVEQQLAAVAAADSRLREAESKTAWTRGLAEGAQLFVMGLAVAAAVVLGAQAVAAGTLPGRDLAVLALTPLALHESFGDLTKAAQTMTHSSAALRRIVELLTATPVGVGDRATPIGDQSTDGDAADVEQSKPSGGAVLQVADLAIGWPEHAPVVEHLDLVVEPGQTVAVTGPSGVGKTTLAATVLGLIPQRGGTIDVTPSVGYLAQDAHIFTTTVAENVRIGNPHASDEQVTQALRQAGLAHLSPERLVGESGATLSGGEARRVALARLLVVSPRPALTLLDEPTEHLDAETAQQLMDDIWATTLPDGALLVLTHDPGVVARCDQEVQLR